MKVSVVLPTNRPRGLDITFSALEAQTLPHDDWQLILIDDHLRDRQQLAFEYAEKCGVKNLKYLKSKPNYWRSNRLIANARNTALVYAEGELVVFVDDYIWFSERFLEEHWKVYKRTDYIMVGALKSVKYVANPKGDLSKLPAPEINEKQYMERLQAEGLVLPEAQLERARQLKTFGVTDTRGSKSKKDCSPGWFYCANSSAPLDKIIEINGFDEEYDLTSEEDIDLGLRLARVGCKFWYRPHYGCTVFHMEHKPVDDLMKDYPKKYKVVSYDELRKRGTLESNPDEIQLVLKEKYDVSWDGSWGLHERNRKRSPYANEGIFNLKEEREKRGYWT